MKPDPENRIECYVDADFAGRWNQEKGNDSGLVLSRTGYVITYANWPIIWGSRILTKIVLSTTEAEYIALSQDLRDILTFVSMMNEIEFALEIQ